MTTKAPATIASIGQAATARLVSAGQQPATARQDVSVLARHVLGWDAARWLTHQHVIAPNHFAQALRALVERRVLHEPVAYIVGEREFYGRSFRVSPAVLIPRPETEGLIEAALEVLRAPRLASRPDPPRVLDVGTGSGCIAITIALEAPTADLEATDLSTEALALARQNAMQLGAANRVRFREASLTGDGSGRFDLIVTNPPYVPLRERAILSPDVRDYEPAIALFGGGDGLDVIRALLPDVARALRPGGTLLMEIGRGQADDGESLAGLAGLEWLGARPDLAGIPRVVVARRTET